MRTMTRATTRFTLNTLYPKTLLDFAGSEKLRKARKYPSEKPAIKPPRRGDYRAIGGRAPTPDPTHKTSTKRTTFEVRRHFMQRLKDRADHKQSASKFSQNASVIWKQLTDEVRRGEWLFLSRESRCRTHFLVYVNERWSVAVHLKGFGLVTLLDFDMMVKNYAEPDHHYQKATPAFPKGWATSSTEWHTDSSTALRPPQSRVCPGQSSAGPRRTYRTFSTERHTPNPTAPSLEAKRLSGLSTFKACTQWPAFFTRPSTRFARVWAR